MTTLNKDFLNTFHKHLAEVFSEQVWEEIKDFADNNSQSEEDYEQMKEFLSKNTNLVSVSE